MIDQHFNFETLSPFMLFNLRLLLHTPEPMINLERDLEELSLYPERLITSHKDEWLHYCRRKLFTDCKKLDSAEEATVKAYLESIVSKLKSLKDIDSPQAETIQRTLTVSESDYVALFESSASRRIRKLIG